MNFWFTKTILLLTATASALATAISLAWAAPASDSQLRPPAGGQVRALIIGIDAYQFEPKLKGAVADARDIEFDIAPQRRR